VERELMPQPGHAAADARLMQRAMQPRPSYGRGPTAAGDGGGGGGGGAQFAPEPARVGGGGAQQHDVLDRLTEKISVPPSPLHKHTQSRVYEPVRQPSQPIDSLRSINHAFSDTHTPGTRGPHGPEAVAVGAAGAAAGGDRVGATAGGAMGDTVIL
jgi:hypothetical protein